MRRLRFMWAESTTWTPVILPPFDYVALGHIHKPQKIGQDNVWYAGAPLAYSFSECAHVKSINVVELGEKGR